MNLDKRIEALAGVRMDGPVVSVTLDVSGRRRVSKPAELFLRERVYGPLESGAREDFRPDELRAAAAAIRRFVDADLKPETDGLYLAAGPGILEAIELRVPLRNSFGLGHAPLVAPLVECAQRWPRVLLVRLSRHGSQVSEFHHGDLAELDHKTAVPTRADVEHPAVGAHGLRHGLRVAGSGSGGDRRDRFRQREEEGIGEMVRDTARAILAWHRAGGSRVFLVGNRELGGLMKDRLPDSLSSALLAAPDRGSPAPRIRAALEDAYRGDVQSRLVEFLERRAEGRHIALGPEATVRAMRDGRMSRLYLTEDAPVPGTECLRCGSLFGGAPERCDYCPGQVRRVSLGEEAVRYTLRHPPCGTTFVPASEHWLTELGGMSALLRN